MEDLKDLLIRTYLMENNSNPKIPLSLGVFISSITFKQHQKPSDARHHEYPAVPTMTQFLRPK